MRQLSIADFISALDKVVAIASTDESPEGQKLAFTELCAVIGSSGRANDTIHGMRSNIQFVYHQQNAAAAAAAAAAEAEAE